MNVEIKTVLRNCLQAIGLGSTIMLLFFEGIYISIIGPIYPLRAISKHDASQTVVALTLAMVPVGQIAAAISFLIFDVKKYIRIVFICAGISSALAIVAFGLVDSIKHVFIYQAICIVNRFITGAAAGGIWAMIFAVVTTYFGEVGGKVSNAFVSFFYMGITLGAQISLFLSSSFHYSTPFYICGVLGLTFVLTSSTMFLQKANLNYDAQPSERAHFSSFIYLCDIGVMVLLFRLFCTNNAYGFFDGILAQFLTEEIGVSSSQLNIAYVIVNIPLLPSSLYFGCYLPNKGYSFLVVFFSLLLNSLFMFLIYLSEYISVFKELYVISFMIFFVYIARSTVVTAIFPVLAIYIRIRFPESNMVTAKVFIGSAFVIIGNIGIGSGSAFFIGYVKACYGIYGSILGIWILNIVGSLNFVYFFMVNSKICIWKKHFLNP